MYFSPSNSIKLKLLNGAIRRKFISKNCNSTWIDTNYVQTTGISVNRANKYFAENVHALLNFLGALAQLHSVNSRASNRMKVNCVCIMSCTRRAKQHTSSSSDRARGMHTK